ASVSPWNLAPLPALVGSSISASDCGRLKRLSRSSAWLLRLEIMDRTAQIAATIPANTIMGIRSSMPSTANNMGVTSRGRSQELPVIDGRFRRILLDALIVNHGKDALLPLTINFVFACAAKFPERSILTSTGSSNPVLPPGHALHLDVDDLANHQGAEQLHDEGVHAHLDTELRGPQFFHIVVLDVEHDQEQQEGQRHQDDARQPAFRREGLDLAEDAETFADDVADLVEDFGEVAAGGSLDADGGHEEAQVEVGNAVAHRLEGVVDRNAEVLL